MSQKMMLCRRLSWAMEIRNMITAAQKALTMTPESSRVLERENERPAAIRKSTPRVARLPAKAVSHTPGKRARPSRMPMMAPMAEPPETPRM